MGELVPWLAIGFIVLVILVGFMMNNSNKKSVVKPIEEADMVERVKIRLSRTDALVVADDIKKGIALATSTQTTAIVDCYEKGTDRLIRFEISHV